MEWDFSPLDSVLKSNFSGDVFPMVLREDHDWLDIQSGMERSGKSSLSLWKIALASQAGFEFDWEGMDNVFFFERNLADKLKLLPNRSAALIDEGGEVLFSRSSMRMMQVKLIQTFMAFGSKQLFIVINIPDWRWIDKAIRESRVRSLFVVRTYPKFVTVEGGVRVTRERGFYSAFSRKRVKLATKNEGSLPKACWSGRFPSFAEYYPNLWSKYFEKKMSFLNAQKKLQEDRRKRNFELQAEKPEDIGYRFQK